MFLHLSRFGISDDALHLLALLFLEVPRNCHEAFRVLIPSAVTGWTGARLRADRCEPPGPPSSMKERAASTAHGRLLELALLLIRVVLVLLHGTISSRSSSGRSIDSSCHARVSPCGLCRR